MLCISARCLVFGYIFITELRDRRVMIIIGTIGFPLFKLKLALLGFKECADVGKHIVHDGLQDVFRHVAFGADGLTRGAGSAGRLLPRR